MSDELQKRIGAVRAQLKKHKLDCLLVQDRNSSYYLSGFPCSNSVILVTSKDAWFFTDSRYILKAKSEIEHLQVEQIAQRALNSIAELATKKKLRTISFEESITYSQFKNLSNAFHEQELKPAGRIITELRLVKSDSEIKQIASNQKLNQQIFKSAVESVTSGMRELDIRNFIRQQMIENSCEEAFESIVASGKNSANPHAVAGNRKITNRALLMFDMGVKKNFYNSDMTRTVVFGDRLPPKALEIYEVVKEAQQAALSLVAPGVACKDIDAAARDVITMAGFGDHFGHGLGHGVGLEIHEGPTLNPNSTDILKAGMVITIEPGIYLPEIGGVRIEDLAVVTENGYKNLTSVSKSLCFLTD